MACCVLGVALVVGLLMVSRFQEAQAAKQNVAFLQPILETLDGTKSSGSVEVSGPCNVGDLPEFPPFRHSATRRDSPIETLLSPRALEFPLW
jgi:hypothetical protein